MIFEGVNFVEDASKKMTQEEFIAPLRFFRQSMLLVRSTAYIITYGLGR